MVRHAYLSSLSEATTQKDAEILTSDSKNGLRLLLPQTFLAELEKFRINNILTTTYSLNGHQKAHCCQQCLKAHAIKTALALELSNDMLQYLEIVFPCEAGHNGYYLNQEELIKT